MADRYWVGGTGTWDATNTTNWSASSGGAGGASVPTTADNVIFDSGSNVGTGSFTVTTGGVSARPCLNLTVTGLDGAMTLAGTIGVTVNGSMSLPAANLSWTNTGTLTFAATTSQTITSNAVTIASPINFNGGGATWALQDALTCTGSAITLTAGTLNLNGYTLTCPTFISSGTGTRAIAYGTTGIISLTGTGTVWNTGTLTNFSYTGTSNVRLIYSGAVTSSISPGSGTAAQAQNFYITAGTYSFSIGTGTVNTLDFTGFSGTYTQSTTSITVFGDLKFSSTMSTSTSSGVLTLGATSGTKNITTSGITLNITITLSGSGATYTLVDNFTTNSARNFTFTAGTLDINNKTTSLGILIFTTGTKSFINGNLVAASVTHTSGAVSVSSTATIVTAGTYTYTAGSISIGDGAVLSVGAFSSSNANARSIAYNTSGELRLTGSGTVWNTSTVTNFSYTGTSNVRLTYASSLAVGITTGAMSSAQAQNFYITAGTYSFTTTTGGAVRNLDFTGFSGTYGQGATTISVYGNLVFSSTMSSTTISGFLNMAGTTQTITCNGDTLGCSIGITAGTTTLSDTFAQASTATLRVTNGNLDFNNQTYTLGTFEFGTGTGVPSNYGAALVCVALVQNRSLTVGTGGYNISTTTHTLTSGTLTIAASYTYSVSAFSSNNSNTRAIAFGSGSILELTGSGTVIDFGTTTVTGFSYTGTSNIQLNYTGASTVTIATGSMTAAQAMNVNVIAGTHTINYTTTSSFNNLNFTGFSGTFAQGTAGCDVFGNLTFSATMTSTSSTPASGALRMASTTGTKTITTNGSTVGLNIYFTGAGGTTQLADSFTQLSTARFAISSTNIVDFNNQINSIGQLYINTPSPSYINYGGVLSPASVYQNSGTVTVGTGALISTAGSYELFAGTITINNGVNLSVGSFISNNTSTRTLAFGTGSITTTGTGTVWNATGATGLTVTGTSNVRIDNPTSTAVTVTNTSASAANAISFYFISGTYTLTLTTGNSYNTLSFAGFTGTAAFVATTHTMYGNLVLGSGMTSTATAGTNTLTWSSSTSSTATITSNGATTGFGIRLNGAGQTIQLADAFVQSSTQLFSYVVGVFDLNNYSASVGAFTISTGTHSFTNGTLNCASVTHTSGDLTTGSTNLLVCSGTYTLTAGSITINNGVTLTVGAFSSSNSNVRSIAFGTGSITISGNAATVWTTATSTNLTSTGTPSLSFTYAGSTGTRTVSNGTASANWPFVFASGTDIVSVLGTYGALDVTSFSGTFSVGGATTITSSSFTIPNTATNGAGAGVITFNASSISFTPSTTGTAAYGITVASTSTLTLGANLATTGGLSLSSGAAASAVFNMNSKTVSVGTLTVGSNSSTHVAVTIQNGTLNCVAFNQTAAIAIGTGYNIISTGVYTCNYGQLTINDGIEFVAGTFTSTTTTAGIVKGIAFGTGSMRLTGTADANETIFTTATGTSLFSFTGTKNITIDDTIASSIQTLAINTVGLTTTQMLNFNVISGSASIFFTSTSVLNDLTFGSGYTGTWSTGTSTHTIYGSLTLSANMSITSTSAILTWSATSGTEVITSNGETIPFNIVLNGVGQTVQLADNFNQTGTFTLTNGTFDMNSKTVQTTTFIILTGTHAIANGTLNCTAVTHTSGELAIGSGYNVVCSGTYTWTLGPITINDNVTLTMFAMSSNNSNAGRSIAFGTSGSITITGKSATVWLVNPAGLTFTGTSLVRLTATGTGTATTINTGTGSSSNALRFAITAGSYPITTASGAGFRGIDFTGYSGTWTITTSINNYGNMVLSSSMTLASTGTITYQSGTYDASFTSNGKTLSYALALSNTGTVTFTDNFLSTSTVTVGATTTLTTSTTSVTAFSFTINGTVNMGSGTWTATGFNTVWSAAVGSTINADTSTLDFTSTSSKTFSGGGKTYYSVRHNGFGTLTIAGNNTFYSISSPYNLSDTTVLFTAGSTQTITGSYDLSAVLPNIITVKTTSAGSTATISKSSGTVTVYRSTIQDIIATGGATWNAFTSDLNTDGGNNTGWNFTAAVVAAIGAFFAFF